MFFYLFKYSPQFSDEHHLPNMYNYFINTVTHQPPILDTTQSLPMYVSGLNRMCSSCVFF